MPIPWALADPNIGEREVLAPCWTSSRSLTAARPGLTLITDKGFAARETEATSPPAASRCCARPARTSPPAAASRCSSPVRQLIESVNDTLKGQLDLEQHGGRSFEGVAVRVAQRLLAMAAAIWHNPPHRRTSPGH